MNPPQRIYLDNGATSWPKPNAVYEAVDRYQRQLGAPAGRGAYRQASEVERLIADARRRTAELLGALDPKRIIFTANGTDSLNLALHGLLAAGDHVVTSDAEHNSVLRPLRYLEETRQVQSTRVPCDKTGLVDAEAIRRAVRPETRLIALVHASNVTGAIQPVEEIGRFARERGILFLVDAAQSVGHLEIDLREMGADLLAAPAHKGLLGPLGLGILYVAPGIEQTLQPVRQGGTGTDSEVDRQPDSLPEKYEAGNLNVPAIVGLGAGVEYLAERGIEDVRRHEMELTTRLVEGLAGIEGATLYGPDRAEDRVGVVSVNLPGFDPRVVAATLDAACSIQVRAGFHCAPLVHRAMGTDRLGGTVRFSLGPFTTAQQIDTAVEAMAEIASGGGDLL